MATQFQPSSFIPKEPVSSGDSQQPRRRKESISIFMVAAIVLFVTSLVAAVGMFVYQRITLANIEAKKDSLAQVQESLNNELIRELIRFDTRLDKGQRLIRDHIAITPFFDQLEQRTLRSVRFTSFSFNRAEEGGNFTVSLDGVTGAYTNVALQLQEFGKNSSFLNPIVANFGFNEQGDVTFTVNMEVDTSLLLYSDQISEQ